MITRGTGDVRPVELTPEARHLVGEAAKHWEDRLTAYAYAEHAAGTAGDEVVTADDVREALGKLDLIRVREIAVESSPGSPRVVVGRAPLAFRLLVIAGVLLTTMSLAGLVAIQAIIADLRLDIHQQYLSAQAPEPPSEPAVIFGDQVILVGAVGVVGVALMGAGVADIARRRRRLAERLETLDDSTADLMNVAELQQKWSVLERAIHRIVAAADPSIGQGALLGTVLHAYGENARLSPAEMAELRSLLQLRNDSAHNRGRIDPSTIADGTRDLDRHIARARQLERRPQAT